MPATVGPLTTANLDQFGLSLLTPSTWQAPIVIDKNSFILSPTGSTDTSPNAGPFLYVVVDALKVFRDKTSFRADFADPTNQLNALVQAINRESPQYDKIVAYTDAKYPAAIIHSYERDNEEAIILINAGAKGWIYIGAQSPERFFKYYETNVFQPVVNSITFTTP